MNLKSGQYKKVYDERWHIELIFRTLKQSIGLQECSARAIEKQAMHIYASFIAYAILQHQKNRNKFKNPEQAFSYFSKLKLKTSRVLTNSLNCSAN